MNYLLPLFISVTLANALIHSETLHLEDAEQVEQCLVDLGASSELFVVSIRENEDLSAYMVEWPDFSYMNLGEPMQIYRGTVEAVAYTIDRAKWEPDVLVIRWGDCITVMPAKDVLEFLDVLEHPEEENFYGYLISHTIVYPHEEQETPELEEGDQF